MKPKDKKRGLESIFGEGFSDILKDLKTAQNIHTIPFEKLVINKKNPRKIFDSKKIDELAESIKNTGLLSPLVVQKDEDDNYLIIAGERRYHALKKLDTKEVMVMIIDSSEQLANDISLIENIQRVDLNPIEEALGVYQLINVYDLKHNEVAKKLGKSRTYITNLLRILKLDKSILDLILNNTLTFGHAKPLINLTRDQQKDVISQITKNKWNVRKTEAYVKSLNITSKSNTSSSKKYLWNKKIEVENNKITIKCKNDKELQQILAYLEKYRN